MPNELWLFPAGIVIAAVASMVGIGGGILWAPLFILALGATPQEAVATSLAIQVVGMGSGSLVYSFDRSVNARLAAIVFVAALPGVICGSLVSVTLPESGIALALGSSSLAVALVFVASRESNAAESPANVDSMATARLLVLPALLGIATGFLSLGIGEWLVPLFRSRAGLDMRRSIATAIIVMFFLAVVAAICHGVLSDNIRYEWFAIGAPGVLLGGQIGPRVSGRLSERLLKETFVFLMTLVGIHLIYGAL